MMIVLQNQDKLLRVNSINIDWKFDTKTNVVCPKT